MALSLVFGFSFIIVISTTSFIMYRPILREKTVSCIEEILAVNQPWLFPFSILRNFHKIPVINDCISNFIIRLSLTFEIIILCVSIIN